MFDAFAYFIEKGSMPSNYNIENTIFQKRPESLSSNPDLTDFLLALKQSSSPFLSTVTAEDQVKIPIALKKRFEAIIGELNFHEPVKNDIEKILTKIYTNNLKEVINLSKTSEDEFVIYTSTNGAYKNILIDEDGDVELLVIPSDKTKTFNKRYYKEDGLNFSTVVNNFNEL